MGVIFRGLADNAYEAHKDLQAVESFNMEMKIFILAVIFSLIIIAVFRFGLPSNWHIGKGVTFAKPEPFDKKQRQTFTLMILMMIVLLAFPILKMIMPANKTIAALNSKIDVGLVGTRL